jgi:hypothetical protein
MDFITCIGYALFILYAIVVLVLLAVFVGVMKSKTIKNHLAENKTSNLKLVWISVKFLFTALTWPISIPVSSIINKISNKVDKYNGNLVDGRK